MVCWRLAVENERLTMTEADEENCKLGLSGKERTREVALSEGEDARRRYVDIMVMARLRRRLVRWIWKCGSLGFR